jgi:ATP-dependent protease ClpP protease subunit
MARLLLTGEVGWELTASNLLDQLTGTEDTEDLDITLSTPGGSVYEAFKLYNILRNWKGQKNITLSGLVASAGTYLAMAGDYVQVEDNAVFMIHDVRAFIYGTPKDFEKLAKVLRSTQKIITRTYSQRTGKPENELEALMSDETYFFGQEIVDFGFADKLVAAGDGAESKAEAIEHAHRVIFELQNKLITQPESVENMAPLAELVAKMDDSLPPKKIMDNKSLQTHRTIVTGVAPHKPNDPKERSMNIENLKTENPELYAAAVKLGAEAEQKRISALRKWSATYPTNADMQTLVNSAIDTGKSESEVLPELIRACQGNSYQGENPPPVRTSHPAATGAQELPNVAPQVHGLTSEELAVCAQLQVTPEAYGQAKVDADKYRVKGD